MCEVVATISRLEGLQVAICMSMILVPYTTCIMCLMHKNNNLSHTEIASPEAETVNDHPLALRSGGTRDIQNAGE